MPPRTTRSKAAAAAPAAAAEADTDLAAPAVAAAAPDVEMKPVDEEKRGDDAADGDDAAAAGDPSSTPTSSDSSDSSDSDSDFEEVDASEEDAAALLKLEEEMAATPSPSYDSHLQLVALLRTCRMSRRLGQARKAAASAFPLPESFWLEWLEDEKKEAVKTKHKKEKKKEKKKNTQLKSNVVPELVALHEAAVADFLSVPLWVSYLQTLREFDEAVASFSPEGASRFRAVADRALRFAGVHVGKGEALWREARAFELDALSESPPRSSVADESRARSLWHRQLSTPLLYGESGGNEPIRAELLEWERERARSGPPASLPAHLLAAADAAASAASARSASEEAVSAAPSSSSTKEELLAAHLAYLRLEERALAAGKGDRRENLKRVLVAHERAVAAFPLTAFLWCSLGSFVEASFAAEDPDLAAAVYKRALRNCPWVGELWARALRAAERRGEGPSPSSSSSSLSSSDEEFDALFRAAMSAPLSTAEEFVECILARLDRMRRKAQGASSKDQAGEQQRLFEELRAAFREASQWLSAAFPRWEDPGLRVASYLPQLELGVGGGGPEAAARAWEQFAAAVPAAAPAASAAATSDAAAAPPTSTLSAEFFVSWARAAVERGLAPGSAPFSAPAVALGRAILKRALGLDGGVSSKKEKGGAAAAAAARKGKDGSAAASVVSLPPTKKLSSGPAAAAAVAYGWLRFEREWGTAEEHFAASLRAAPLLEAAAVAAAAAAAASAPGSDAAVAAAARSGAAGPAPAPARPPQPERTKEELLALRREKDPNFNKKKEKEREKEKKTRENSEGGGQGPAKRARTDGGEETTAAPAALQHQPQRQQSPSAGPFVPRAADAEHRTAFVRGFPAGATEAALAEFFAKASSAAESKGEEAEAPPPPPPPPSSSSSLPVVRRPKGPDGQPRGFCYVEFGSTEALARAVANADGKRFGGGEDGSGSVLSVAVSRPPAAGGGGRGAGGGRFGGGGGRGRGRGRGGLGFGGRGGGRGVHLDLGGGPLPSSAAAAPAAGTAAPTSFVPRVVVSSSNAPPPKSNADFRAMLLGEKK